MECVIVWILCGICVNFVFSYFCDKSMNISCGCHICCCNEANVSALCLFWDDRPSIPKLPKTIKDLVIRDNRLLHISSETFININDLNLRALTLTNNTIETIDEDAFVHMKQLQTLGFHHDKKLNTSTLWRSFKYFDSLKSLSLNDIGLYELTDSSFSHLNTKHMKTLVLSNNCLHHLNFTVLKGWESLATLELNKNQLKSFSQPVLLLKLRVLYINGNRLTFYPPFLCPTGATVSYFPKLVALDLSQNLIRDLNNDAVSCLQRLQHLYLEGNRIQIIANNAFSELPNLSALGVNGMKDSLKTIQPKAFNSSSLKSLYLQSNNLQLYNTYIRHNSSAVNIFDYCTQLTLLDVSLNNFNLPERVFSRIFLPLKDLQELKMVKANLFEIPSSFFNNFPNISTMILNQNRIHNINASSFNISSLKFLSLQGNHISDVREADFPVILRKSLTQFNLRDNPFDCSCEMLWFRNWIDNSQNKQNKSGSKLEGWPVGYTCKTPSTLSGKPFISFQPTEEECTYHNQLTIFYIISGIVVLVTISTSLVAYKKRWYITYLFYKIKLGQKQKNTEQCSLLRPNKDNFDGYVIYSDEDSEFVHNDLIAIVEEEMKYKLHVWHRNACSGAKMKVMVDGIYNSDKVVAVISNSFLKDSWCQFQLTVALDRQVELNCDNVILIILEDVDLKSLSKSWCVILTKIPSAYWCHTAGDIKRNVFEQKLIDHFRKHVEINE